MKKGHLLLIEHFNGRTLPSDEIQGSLTLSPNIVQYMFVSDCLSSKELWLKA